MKSIENIYLVWRKGKGERRHKVGIIERNADGIIFKYIISKKEANDIGFIVYTDFPDLSKEYKDNVVDIFGQRLTKSDRGDIQKYYDFWEIKPEYRDDKYYLLAHTQGLLATDNFEFLADYSPSKDLSFVSEICGLSHYKIAPNLIKEEENLEWQFDKDNEHDKSAVKILKNGKLLGYVKTAHSKVFYKCGGEQLKVRVKSTDSNGYLNRAFIKVYHV